jgi:hypothetical protein
MAAESDLTVIFKRIGTYVRAFEVASHRNGCPSVIEIITEHIYHICSFSIILELPDDSQAYHIFKQVLGRGYTFCYFVERILNGECCDIQQHMQLSEEDEIEGLSNHKICFEQHLDLKDEDVLELQKVEAYLESSRWILWSFVLATM